MLPWDLEQNLDFNAQDASFDAKELSEYPFSKNVYPAQKKAPYFIWRVPALWHQFIDTNAVQPLIYNNIPFYNFFQNCTGYKNIRSPTKIMGGHENWWGQTKKNFTNFTAGNKLKIYKCQLLL
ncbi:putative capsid protein [Trichonephila clavata]|uniref:Putative capsid protein n=1 Tax=Trichonephila clavata TaxID=2740835 RepID=A0A8X6FF84_TRICU|nr:putative capsid protein [Trichonephila clavata]